MKLSLFFADKARSILRLHDPYPSPLKGIGTSAAPGLSEGCKYNGLLESIKLGALVVVEPDSSIAMINEINTNPEKKNSITQIRVRGRRGKQRRIQKVSITQIRVRRRKKQSEKKKKTETKKKMKLYYRFLTSL